MITIISALTFSSITYIWTSRTKYKSVVTVESFSTTAENPLMWRKMQNICICETVGADSSSALNPFLAFDEIGNYLFLSSARRSTCLLSPALRVSISNLKASKAAITAVVWTSLHWKQCHQSCCIMIVTEKGQKVTTILFPSWRKVISCHFGV